MKNEIKIKILQNLLNEVTKKYDYFIANKEHLYKKTYEMAVKDALTGVYNRQYLEDYLFNTIKKLKRKSNEKVLLVFFDLDNFKHINDNYGHQEGDEVLKKVVKIIKEFFRDYDLVVRFGGDEFIVAVENESKPNLIERIKKLQKRIEEEFKEYSISVSYGISVLPDDVDMSAREEEILKKFIETADERMYENKREKKKNR